MASLLPLAIGLGLCVSLLCSEFFGLAAGGLVVPGYLALSVRQPAHVGMTLAVALLTYFIVAALAHVLIIYGRRRTALMLLVGFVLGQAASQLPALPFWEAALATETAAAAAAEAAVVGHILPGLLALWFDRQGVVETLCAVLTSTALVRLLLMLCAGEVLLP